MHYALKACGGADVQINIFLSSVLLVVGGEWLVSYPGSFILGERALITHWIGSWVGPRAGVDDLKKR
jgi:hypothetical protein